MALLKHVSPAEITVRDRHRTDMGDLDSLMSSLRDVGLLQPLVVTSDLVLIAGERRLRAVQSLAWGQVPVYVVDEIETAGEYLRAERDENVCRKDMTPSELVSLADALSALEAPKAAQRQARHGAAPGRHVNTSRDGARSVSPTDLDRSLRTDETVARALGIGATRLREAQHVVRTAADPSQPSEVRVAAGIAKKEMDETGNVSGAYKKVRGAQSGLPAPPDTAGRVLRAAPVAKSLTSAMGTLRGLAIAFKSITDESLTDLDPSQRASTVRDLTDFISAARRLRTQLTQETS